MSGQLPLHGSHGSREGQHFVVSALSAPASKGPSESGFPISFLGRCIGINGESSGFELQNLIGAEPGRLVQARLEPSGDCTMV